MIDGIPWHPLTSHAPLVLIPLAMVLILLGVLARPIRKQVAAVGVVLAVLAAISAFIARSTGYELSQDIGVPEEHSQWAFPLVIATTIFAAAAVIWWISLLRAPRDPESGKPHDSALTRILGFVAILGGIAATVLTVLAGHSGAAAVWANDDSDTVSESTTDDMTADDATSAQTESATESIAMTEVEENASPDSCWAVVDDGVYDLTDWVDQHPGGSGAIESLCGTDATERFTAQHGGSSGPEEQLEQLRIGELAN